MIEWGIDNLSDGKNTPELTLGVGIPPYTDTPWNHVLDDNGELIQIIDTETKNIRRDIIK